MEGTKKFDTVQLMIFAIETSYLRGLVTNAVRSNIRGIKKTCKDVPAKFSKKYITSNVLPAENDPYRTANRGTEHPNTPDVLVN